MLGSREQMPHLRLSEDLSCQRGGPGYARTPNEPEPSSSVILGGEAQRPGLLCDLVEATLEVLQGLRDVDH